MSDLLTVDASDLRRHFPKEPFPIRHGLVDHPLFTLPALAKLARTLPRDRVEFNSGDLEPGVRPEHIKMIDLAPDEVVRRIETANAWMVLKRVESDPAYRDLLKAALDGVARQLGRKDAADAGFHDIQGFLFVSSANATTPFHFDPEENLFVQIRGPKFFHLFDNRDHSIIPEEEFEISPSKHRNMAYEPEFEEKAQVFTLAPGEGVFVPHLWPHWVRTGGEYSVSLAVTWKSPRAERLNTLLAANGLLRRLGWTQAAPGRRPLQDSVKILGFSTLRKAIEPLRAAEGTRRWLRGLVFGKQANYYYREGNAEN